MLAGRAGQGHGGHQIPKSLTQHGSTTEAKAGTTQSNDTMSKSPLKQAGGGGEYAVRPAGVQALVQRKVGPSLIEAPAAPVVPATKPAPAVKPAKKEPKYNFRLSDVQAFYDLQLIKGTEEDDALELTIEKFDLPAKDVEVSPAGFLIVKDLEPESAAPEGGIIPGGGGGDVATGAGSVLANATKSTEISFKQNEPAKPVADA